MPRQPSKTFTDTEDDLSEVRQQMGARAQSHCD
jgi:hypothetical protein